MRFGGAFSVGAWCEVESPLTFGEHGFSIEARSDLFYGVSHVVVYKAGCRVASREEVLMSEEIIRLRKEIDRLEERLRYINALRE